MLVSQAYQDEESGIENRLQAAEEQIKAESEEQERGKHHRTYCQMGEVLPDDSQFSMHDCSPDPANWIAHAK